MRRENLRPALRRWPRWALNGLLIGMFFIIMAYWILEGIKWGFANWFNEWQELNG
jgi:hypothetical protein